jgi:hypothetical protein
MLVEGAPWVPLLVWEMDLTDTPLHEVFELDCQKVQILREVDAVQ